jgi:hypothetical protein
MPSTLSFRKLPVERAESTEARPADRSKDVDIDNLPRTSLLDVSNLRTMM